MKIGINSSAKVSRYWGVYLLALLCVQRAAASLAPTRFRSINTKKACVIVSIISGLVPLSLELPKVFLNRLHLENGRYVVREVSEALAGITLYNNLAVVPLILISAALAVIGLMKAVRLGSVLIWNFRLS